MKTPLLANEQVLFEEGGGLVGAMSNLAGGHVILTNQRLLHESLKGNVDFELDVTEIVGYRHAYNVGVGNLLPMKNAFSVFTKQNVSQKFAMNKRDKLFQHFKQLIPAAQQLPDEKYGEGLAGVGSKIASNVKGTFQGTQGNMPAANAAPVSQVSTSAAEMINCPECSTANLKTSKFCNSCGGKLQLECPNCNAPIEDGKKFCGQCGTPIKSKNECPNCGANTTKGQKFCNECGGKIEE